MKTPGCSLHGARGIAAALACVGFATAAGGDPAGAPLAPPGPCAEPRSDLRAAPDAGPMNPEADDFDVAGSPRHHFTPQDVAAPGGDEGLTPPPPPGFTREACDAPNAGCASILDAAGRGIKESPAQPGLPPGTRQEDLR